MLRLYRAGFQPQFFPLCASIIILPKHARIYRPDLANLAGDNLPGKLLLTAGTDAKEFQMMSHTGKPALRSDASLPFPWKTILQLYHFRAPGAYQMVMVAVIAVRKQFKAGTSVPEVISLHH